MAKISKSGWISDCFIFSYEELAIQLLCLRYDSLDILHDAVGIIFLSTRDTFQARDILSIPCKLETVHSV